jgi:hypothetical protein
VRDRGDQSVYRLFTGVVVLVVQVCGKRADNDESPAASPAMQ